MPIIRDAIRAITKAPNTERLPQGGGGGFGLGLGAGVQQTSQLNAMTSSGWLFAVIDRIATSVAAVEWKLFQEARNGERAELMDDFALQLWNKPNPFYTNNEFIKTLVQHYELVGEMWILILRDSLGLGVPLELWPIRPDRIKPIPHPTEFISGYVYQVGNVRIPIEIDDIIFIRRPSPTDPYRGVGVVQSILTDINSDKAAAAWTNAFFLNDATPGGIVELDEPLDDTEFNNIVRHWKQQQQGVQNAHRVMFIERGHFSERKFTNRDIQLTDLRHLTRDTIFGAFGMPASVMGVSENVNRANAEAGQVMFSQNIVVPLLEDIKIALNERLASMFGDNLVFDYDDPTPENREANVIEAREMYVSGLYTRNESRAVMSKGEADVDGDEFFEQPQASLTLAMPERGDIRKMLKSPSNPLWPNALDAAESRIQAAWAERLEAEAEGLIKHLEQFS